MFQRWFFSRQCLHYFGFFAFITLSQDFILYHNHRWCEEYQAACQCQQRRTCACMWGIGTGEDARHPARMAVGTPIRQVGKSIRTFKPRRRIRRKILESVRPTNYGPRVLRLITRVIFSTIYHSSHLLYYPTIKTPRMLQCVPFLFGALAQPGSWAALPRYRPSAADSEHSICLCSYMQKRRVRSTYHKQRRNQTGTNRRYILQLRALPDSSPCNAAHTSKQRKWKEGEVSRRSARILDTTDVDIWWVYVQAPGRSWLRTRKPGNMPHCESESKEQCYRSHIQTRLMRSNVCPWWSSFIYTYTNMGWRVLRLQRTARGNWTRCGIPSIGKVLTQLDIGVTWE